LMAASVAPGGRVWGRTDSLLHQRT